MIKVSILSTLLLLIFACNNEEATNFRTSSNVDAVSAARSEEGFKIANGEIIEPNEKAGILLLMTDYVDSNGEYMGTSRCTATAVAHNKLLTAAHCVLGGTDIYAHITDYYDATTEFHENYYESENIIGATKFELHPLYTTCSGAANCAGADLAVVTFPTNSFSQTWPVNLEEEASSMVGHQVDIVGYGIASPDRTVTQTLVKRKGTNQLEKVLEAGESYSFDHEQYPYTYPINVEGPESGATLLIKGFSANNGEPGIESTAQAGDSGGPMLHNGKIIGVASWTWQLDAENDENSQMNGYSSLYHSKDWLSSMLQDPIKTITLDLSTLVDKDEIEIFAGEKRMFAQISCSNGARFQSRTFKNIPENPIPLLLKEGFTAGKPGTRCGGIIRAAGSANVLETRGQRAPLAENGVLSLEELGFKKSAVYQNFLEK